MMERFFRFSDNKSSLRTELLAGVTTFLTMAYIVFVQPAVLSGKMFGGRYGNGFRRGHNCHLSFGSACYGNHGFVCALPDRPGAGYG
jgi:hypothetical protein